MYLTLCHVDFNHTNVRKVGKSPLGNQKLHSRILYIYFQLLCNEFLTERRNAMERIPDIILALIDQIPWFAIVYTVHKIYTNKPKKTSISIPDKFTITSER